MRALDRLFLFLFSLAFIIVALFALLFGLGFFNKIVFYDLTNILYYNNGIKLAITIVSLIIILLGINFIIKSLHTKQTPTFSNKQSEIGEIRISMDTLENLASKVTRSVKGVNEERVKVRLDENNKVTVIVKIYVDGETSIPTISENIQLKVSETIQQIAGIDVEYVHIIVANVGRSKNRKSRVE